MNKLYIAKKVLSGITCTAMALGIVTAYISAPAGSQDASAKTIAEIQEQRKQNSDKIAALENEISGLEGDKANEKAYQDTLTEQIGLIQENINLLNAELESIKQNIYDGLTKLLPEGMAAMRLPLGKDSVTADNAAIRAYTTPAPQILRFAGSNRFETAAKISQDSKLFDGADTVVIANGMDYADALAGVPLAAKLKAPILLTRTDKLSGETAAEIDRLKVKNAVILGGTNAVSEDVEKAIKDKGVSVERVFGKTRYSTAVQIANKLNEEPEDVFLAYGLDFADALSASAAAAVKGAPIVYINKNGALNADTKAYLESIKGKVKNAYVIGGSAVVSDDVMKQAAQALGIEKAERISGANRYATGAAVNEKFGDVLTGEVVCAATGTDFPDALAGGVYAAMNKAALVLVNGKAAAPTLTAEQKDYLSSKDAGTIAVFGGTGAVSDDYAAAVKAAMQAK